MDTGAILAMLGFPSAVTGLCFWFIKRHFDKIEKKRAEREEAHEQLQIILVEGVNASLALGEATAEAVQTGNCNGKMTKALAYAVSVKHNQKNFLTKQGVKHVI